MWTVARFRKHFILNIIKENRNVYAIARAAASQSNQNFKSWKEIPSLSSLPFIGQLHHFLPGGCLNKCTEKEVFTKLRDWFGPITTLELPFMAPMIVVYDLEAIAQVYYNENWMPVRRTGASMEYYRKYYSKYTAASSEPYGLFSQGEAWKKTRSVVNPITMNPKTIKFYAPTMKEVAQDFIKRIRSLRDENNKLTFGFDRLIELWALEAIGVVVLGRRLHCFDADLADDSPVKKLINCSHDFFRTMELLDMKIGPALWKYYPTKAFRNAMKVYQDLDDSTSYFTKLKLKELQETGTLSDENNGLLEQLLQKNEHIAMIVAGDFLMAGVDTTSLTMFNAIYMLAINPEKQNKLRDVLNKSNNESKSYLKACIKESMRLRPISGISIMRDTTKKHNLLGYEIPENVTIRLHQNDWRVIESNFPRANEYIPERWVVPADHPLYYGNAHPFAFTPFGFGVRSCAGRRIAEMELEVIVANMVQNFKIEWNGPPPNVINSVFYYVEDPFYFVFKDL